MKKNLSYTYLLPLLGVNVFFNRQMLECIKNTYMFSSKHFSIFCLVIVCNFNNAQEFKELEERMISSSNFIESHDIGEDIVYVYKFPERFENEHKYLQTGKYSEFSLEAKKIILSFWSKFFGMIPSFVSGTLTKIKHILFKDDKYKEKIEDELNVKIKNGSELGTIIDIEKELYVFEEKIEV